MISFFRSSLFLFCISAMLSSNAYATRESRPLPTDKRIRLITYHPNDVFSYTGFYNYLSSIVFSPEERIATLYAGNTKAWQIDRVGNRLFLKPVAENATTNMTVITNKRLYQFELHAKEANKEKGLNDEEMVFEMRFVYPDESATGNLQYNHQSGMPDLSQPERYNFNYTIAGNSTITPVRIFDDGEFTYFQFPGRNADIPAFFIAGSDQKEALVNYRVTGDYIVIERVASKFTLRNGSEVLCVFNESMPGAKKK